MNGRRLRSLHAALLWASILLTFAALPPTAFHWLWGAAFAISALLLERMGRGADAPSLEIRLLVAAQLVIASVAVLLLTLGLTRDAGAGTARSPSCCARACCSSAASPHTGWRMRRRWSGSSFLGSRWRC